MQSAPDRPNESAALAALRDLAVLDTAPEAEFDALVRVASIVCRAPIALISLVDTQRQWFKAQVGLEGVSESPRESAFCAHTVLGNDIFEVADAAQEGRFADNPLVTGYPHIRHYAGAPIRLSDGLCVGALCIVDRVPGHLDRGQRQALNSLAIAAASALEGRRATQVALQSAMASALTPAGLVFNTVELEHRTTLDALTGLVNRAEFERRLGEAVCTARDGSAEHAVLHVDLDQFRLINDACGHRVGDLLLKEVAALLATMVRATDTLARVGGDEFAVIMERCSAQQAEQAAQRICERLEDFRFAREGLRLRIGASIGLVGLGRDCGDVSAVVQAAETSCRAAGEDGGSRVQVWSATESSFQARHGEMQWATRIELALDDDRFVLFAQRIEPITAGVAGVHAEVLLRMLDVDGSLIPPGLFLPAAERFHLATRIDRWVLRRAVAWMKALPAPERIAKLSVNLSGQSVGDRAFHGWALALLAGAGDALCRRLCLEITETAAVAHMAEAAHFVTELRALGVHVALDDFGAGASSFGYLKRLPVDYLKIDGQFIRELLTDPLNDAAVRCFVDVARVVGVQTVAEFVDQPAVLARLGELGVDFAQGYLLHRPAPLDQLLDPRVEPANVMPCLTG